MKFAVRVLIPLFLSMISMSLLMTTPEVFAKENGVRTSNPPLNLQMALTFQPKIGEVLLPAKFSLAQDGTISVTATPWAVDTPLGVVSLDATLSTPPPPQISPQAQKVAMLADSLLLIVRHRHGTVLEDSNHQFRAVQIIQGIDIEGPINKVSLKYTENHFTVFIDASGSDTGNIILQSVSENMPATAKTCKVALAEGLNVRTAPTSQSPRIAYYIRGTVLNFIQVVHGEAINGNSLWGFSKQGHYFWLGGTDHQMG